MNESSKPWYFSKGFLGPLVTAILISLRNLGVCDLDTDTTLGVIYDGIELLGAVFGITGRVCAKKKISFGFETPASSSAKPPSQQTGGAQEGPPSTLARTDVA